MYELDNKLSATMCALHGDFFLQFCSDAKWFKGEEKDRMGRIFFFLIICRKLVNFIKRNWERTQNLDYCWRKMGPTKSKVVTTPTFPSVYVLFDAPFLVLTYVCIRS